MTPSHFSVVVIYLRISFPIYHTERDDFYRWINLHFTVHTSKEKMTALIRQTHITSQLSTPYQKNLKINTNYPRGDPTYIPLRPIDPATFFQMFELEVQISKLHYNAFVTPTT